ncbi:hypothetical protein DERF_012992 [Dermatophagoides farinae]|uniref:Uncharacterized protein n=1 Tax=Dermatophagoides farinae TaxID=6954 RepID=A0A922HKV6_DERFA|nr:hypothetical protein DERF_012992 [Dermatophagoides farinae]
MQKHLLGAALINFQWGLNQKIANIDMKIPKKMHKSCYYRKTAANGDCEFLVFLWGFMAIPTRHSPFIH